MDLTLTSEEFLAVCEEVLGRGAKLRCELRGTSMVPTIQNGQEVEISPCASVRLGDIVLIRTKNGRAIAHRVIAKRDGRIRLQGDGNLRHDAAWHSREAVLGRVTAVRRGTQWHRLDTLAARLKGRLYFPLRRRI